MSQGSMQERQERQGGRTRNWAAAGGLALLALTLVCGLAAQHRAASRAVLLVSPNSNWWSRVVSNSAAQVIIIPVSPAAGARRRCPPPVSAI